MAKHRDLHGGTRIDGVGFGPDKLEAAHKGGRLIIVDDDPTSPFHDAAYEPPTEDDIADFMVRGVHQPPTLTQRPEKRGGKTVDVWRVVAGRKRVTGLLEANRRLAAQGKPGHVLRYLPRYNLTDLEVREIMVSENERRRRPTLKRSILHVIALHEEAQRSAEAQGDEWADNSQARKAALARIQITAGVPQRSTLERMLAVPYLSAATQRAIYDERIPLTAVDELRGMPPADQKEAVAKLEESGAATTKAARKAISEVPSASRPKPPEQKRVSRKVIGEVRDVLRSSSSGYADVIARTLDWISGGEMPAEVQALLDAQPPKEKGKPGRKPKATSSTTGGTRLPPKRGAK